jgi:hypothetical protein
MLSNLVERTLFEIPSDQLLKIGLRDIMNHLQLSLAHETDKDDIDRLQ